jgi:hypothetical protein
MHKKENTIKEKAAKMFSKRKEEKSPETSFPCSMV